MGTSKSHPSPRGTSDAGKAWKEFDSDMATTCRPADAVDAVLKAYSGEYKSIAADKLVDAGVEIIESLVQNFKPKSQDYFSQASEFIEIVRKNLSDSNSNSFLSELALSSVGSSILKQDQDDRVSTFRRNYLSKIVDYSLSRDFPRLFGSKNLTNHSQMESFVNEVKASLVKDKELNKPLKAYVSQRLSRIVEGNE